MKTKIEWATDVWNPVTGCTKVSQGCKNCYAERLAGRFWGERKFTDVQVHPDRLVDPIRWKKPRRVFVNSMSDLFHPDVPFDFILRVWITIAWAANHSFLILTKRPERMKIFVNEWLPGAWALATESMKLLEKPLPNVWLGVSVEDQKTADERIPLLLQTPAAVRFVSCEPLLGPVDLSITKGAINYGSWSTLPNAERINFPYGIAWVICGGESGPGARPMHPDWARSLRDQCQVAGVPFFFKQWGEWGTKTYTDGDLPGSVPDDKSWDYINTSMRFRVWESERRYVPGGDDYFYASIAEKVGKKLAGRLLDGREWNEVPHGSNT